MAPVHAIPWIFNWIIPDAARHAEGPHKGSFKSVASGVLHWKHKGRTLTTRGSTINEQAWSYTTRISKLLLTYRSEPALKTTILCDERSRQHLDSLFLKYSHLEGLSVCITVSLSLRYNSLTFSSRFLVIFLFNKIVLDFLHIHLSNLIYSFR